MEAEPQTNELLEDDAEEPEPEPGEIRTHPLAGKSLAELERMLLESPEQLGSISWGHPNGGALLGGVRMPEGPHHELLHQDHIWGTQETVDALLHCLETVASKLPGGARPYVGHLSRRHGGPLSPHVSHQSGRDADVGYYLLGPAPPFARATAHNMDLDRTWAFVRCLITDTDVDLILIDRTLTGLLRQRAEELGENQAWLDSIFGGSGASGARPLVLHAPGHATHLHVRFTCPLARETARLLRPLLVRHRMVTEPHRTVAHRARPGDTLGKLARRYSTTVKSIMQANGLKSTTIRAGQVYRIPTCSGARVSDGPLVVPPRRLPPSG